MKTLTDNSLMLGVKNGDLDKMGLLFERYHKVLLSFVYNMCGQAAKSEDLVQTVFYRMLKYRHTYKEKGEFKSWMFHLARNVLNDSYRKNGRMSYHEDVSVLGKQEVVSGADIQIEKQQDADTLQQALLLIKPEFREVLLLSKFQELPYREIATILDTTESNVKIRVHRGMKELKNIYLNRNNEARIGQ